MRYVDDIFKKDKEIVLEAVKQNGRELQYADTILKYDKDVVLEAVKQNGMALAYADDSLKKDKEVVLEAVKQDGYTLKYADDSLKKYKEVVLEAIKNYGDAFQYADDSLKKDKEFVLEAVKKNIYAYHYINNGILTGKELYEYCPTIQLIICLPDNMIKDEFTYHISLNIDNRPFYPTEVYQYPSQSGGLYCTTPEYANFYRYNNCTKVWKVTIPDDALVYVAGPNRLKVDRLIINED